MSIGASTCDGTTSDRISGGGDIIAVQCEVGNVFTSFGSGERVSMRGGYGFLNSNFRPVGEGVTSVGGGRQGDGFAVGECASTFHSTAVRWIDRSGDFIAVQAEVSHVCSCFGGGETVGGVSRNLNTTLCPVGEGVTCVGGSRQGDGLAVSIGASTCDGTTSDRISGGGDIIAVQCEVGNVFTSFGSGERVSMRGGYGFLNSNFRPVGEGVASVGGGRQGDGFAVGVCASTFHSTAVRWVNRSGDIIVVQGEVGHVCTGFDSGETVGGVCGNFFTSLCPVGEGVTSVGDGRQGDGFAVSVCTSTVHSTAVRWVNRSCNLVAVESEVNRQCSVLRYSKINGVRCDFLTADCPAYEMVVFCRDSRQFGSGSLLIFAIFV